VEVIHRRSGRTASSKEATNSPARSAHAATWPEGFQGPFAPILRPMEDPAATPPPVSQVGHLMPSWEPLLPPLQPAEPVSKVPTGIRSQRRVAKAERSENEPIPIKRTCADPSRRMIPARTASAAAIASRWLAGGAA
jgi:hypothetical protein